jgi:ELP3 family radical SAM enzyme/protein acetyltransferase
MCQNPNYDLEAFEKRIDDFISREFEVPSQEDAMKLKPIIEELIHTETITQLSLHKMLSKRKLMQYRKNSFIIQSLYLLIEMGEIDAKHEDHIKNLLRVKRGKSHSGIISVTILTSPYPSYKTDDGTVKKQMFTCKYNCHYCPNEPGQPKSYLKAEPAVARANRYEFDACQQMWGRMSSLYNIGHKIDKIECLILGGSWASYPEQYREEFIRDTYYAANTFCDKEKREKLSMKEEMIINKDARCRIIGLTLETHPSDINKREIQLLRSYGCTRLQLGVQHLDNEILKAVNRRCTTERLAKSLQLLKNSCFKIDEHIMPNLPFSSPEKDRHMMLDRFLGQKSPMYTEMRDGIEWEIYDVAEPDIQGDQWKIYPCETVPYTEIEKWYRNGDYKPYAEEDLFKLIYDTKLAMFPWIRCNRLIRDISKPYIICSSNHPNTGQLILDELKKNGHRCACIRCAEVKEKDWDGTYKLLVRHYKASGGDEYFISATSDDKYTLYGFCRLRLCSPAVDIFPELENCGLIRELHVYSNMNPVGENQNTVQHKGIGKKLISLAENIAQKNNRQGVAIIAGIGVQRYYEKQGYTNDSEGKGDFMIKYF